MKLPKKGTDSGKWEKVETGNGDSFEILIRKPTFEELLRDHERADHYTKDRLKNCVIDWRGVETDGDEPKPVSYSFEGLSMMCAAFPKAALRIVALVAIRYAGITEDELKNFDPPSGQTETDGGSKIDSSTATSESPAPRECGKNSESP